MKCPKCGAEMISVMNDTLDVLTSYQCPVCGNVHHRFVEVLLDYKNAIKKIAFNYLGHKMYSPSHVDNPELESFFWKLIQDYPNRGGKYVRGSLVVMGCEGFNGPRDAAIQTAAAMELSQNWMLIHDDVEDDSKKRRGKPALHKRYNVPLAINAGDALHAITWKSLFDNLNELGPKITLKLVDEFYNIIIRTAAGQHAEIYWFNGLDLDYDDVYYIIDGKTSYYTIAGPLRLGAIIAGRDDKLEQISEFGTYLGRAFQIIDDLLDLTSDFKGLKVRGGDIIEGKRTVMLIHLLKNADEFDRKKVEEIMMRKPEQRTKSDVDFIISLMNEYGSLKFARDQAEKFAHKSITALQKIDYTNPSIIEKLKLAIDFIVNREY